MDKVKDELNNLLDKYQSLEKKQKFEEERINSTEKKLGGVERQQNYVFKEINDIRKYAQHQHAWYVEYLLWEIMIGLFKIIFLKNGRHCQFITFHLIIYSYWLGMRAIYDLLDLKTQMSPKAKDRGKHFIQVWFEMANSHLCCEALWQFQILKTCWIEFAFFLLDFLLLKTI